MNMSSIEVDRNGQIHVKNPEPKVEHINVSRKSNKKRMKQVGSVELPQEAFMSVLSMDEED